MLLKEYKDSLQSLVNYKITNSMLGEVLNTTSQNISKRIKGNSELTVSELSKLEQAFGVFHFDEPETKKFNSLNRQKSNISEAFSTWGTRLCKIQAKNSLSDEKMAEILEVSINEYDDIVADSPEPNFKLIRNIIENFDVDLNWLFAAKEIQKSNSDIINSLSTDKFQKLMKLLDE